MTVVTLKCPVMNRESAEESRGYSSPAVPNYDVLVNIGLDSNPIGVICPDYKGGRCVHREATPQNMDDECIYLSGWKTKRQT